MRGKNDRYVPGTYNAICDVCGFKFKANQLKTRWDGLKVCSRDFELRHPLDFARVPNTEKSIPWSRPEKVVVNYFEQSSRVGVAVAGMSIVGS